MAGKNRLRAAGLAACLACAAASASLAEPPPAPTALDQYYRALKRERNPTPEKMKELKERILDPARRREQAEFYQAIQDEQARSNARIQEEALKWKLRYEIERIKQRIRQKRSQPFVVAPSGAPSGTPPIVIRLDDRPAVSKGRKARTASPRPVASPRPGSSPKPKKGASPSPEPPREEVVLDGSKIPAELEFEKGKAAPEPAPAPQPAPDAASPGPSVSGAPEVSELHFGKRSPSPPSPAVASPKAGR